MTAASKRAPYCNRCTGFAKRRPGPNEGKAAVVEEETGRCTPRAAGGGGQARREGVAHESVRARQAGSRLLTRSMRSRRAREHRACAKGLWALGSSRSTRTWWAGEPWSARGSKPERTGVYGGQHVSFVRAGKATVGEPRSEPDWGHPTVRDRRGAFGNVDYGGTRTPSRVSKERVLETLRLTLCAPQLYPDLLSSKGT